MTTIKTLALDTVFEQCSVAFLNNDELIGETTILGNRGQTETILPMIDELLKTHKKLSPIHQRM
ncbi:hypothetical protein [Moraxella oblonga]|uniref:hypothetical protein n=1 Tax=Moraxella oblonga TaxID=200413 RepID=UPI00082E142C|nr:hypothetical protein [Moraxella oblonga]